MQYRGMISARIKKTAKPNPSEADFERFQSARHDNKTITAEKTLIIICTNSGEMRYLKVSVCPDTNILPMELGSDWLLALKSM